MVGWVDGRVCVCVCVCGLGVDKVIEEWSRWVGGWDVDCVWVGCVWRK